MQALGVKKVYSKLRHKVQEQRLYYYLQMETKAEKLRGSLAEAKVEDHFVEEVQVNENEMY